MGERRPWYCFSHCSGRKTAPVLGNSIEEILYVELEIEVLEEPKSQTGNCETTQRLTTAKSSRKAKGLTDTVMRRYKQVSEASRCGGNWKHNKAPPKDLCMDMLFHRTWSHVPSLEVSGRDATQELVGSGGVQGSNFLSSHPPISRQCLTLGKPDRKPGTRDPGKCSSQGSIALKITDQITYPIRINSYETSRVAVIWFAVFFP